MVRCFSLLTAAIFLSFLPVSGMAQQDPGIPPMLENNFPMSVPAAKLPTVEPPAKAAAAPKAPASTKAKSASKKKVKKAKGRLATKKSTKPAAKKKGVSAKPRGKSKANSS